MIARCVGRLQLSGMLASRSTGGRGQWSLNCRKLARSFSEANNELVEFAFRNKDGSLTVVKCPKGQSVLEAAHNNLIDLEGACEASLACR